MIIVITLPYFTEREAERIVQRLAHVDLIHLRKPESTSDELERLIRDIPAEYHSRLVLHDHHHLAVKYGLYGIHLNSRNPIPPQGWKGSISRSCHSLEEIKEWKDRGKTDATISHFHLSIIQYPSKGIIRHSAESR